jgi:membrane fusion protein (multidrug efflux system)
MNIVKHITIVTSLIILASCGSSKKGDTLADKKTKLTELKKQQDDLNKQITALQAEIVKLDSTAAPEKAKLVAVTKLNEENFNHYIDLQARVDADNIAYVTSRGAPGQVKAVYVKQGDFVKKGQLLLKLDDAIIKQQLQQAQTQLGFAQDIYNRRNNLWKEGIGTEVDFISAKNNVDQAQKQVDIIEEQLSFSNVRAETSGVADEVTIRVGETFPSATGVIKIVNNNDLKIVAEVPENYLNRVKTGSSMVVTLPDINKTFNTTVNISGKVIDPNSRSFYIEARIPAGTGAKPNELAVAKILDYSANNAITISVNTLQTDEQGKYVLVAENKNGKLYAQKKRVEIGELYGDKIEIKNGLQSGDMLITDGYNNLYDGQLITTNS